MPFCVRCDSRKSRPTRRLLPLVTVACLLSVSSCVRPADASWVGSPSAGMASKLPSLAPTAAETPAAVSTSERPTPSDPESAAFSESEHSETASVTPMVSSPTAQATDSSTPSRTELPTPDTTAYPTSNARDYPLASPTPPPAPSATQAAAAPSASPTLPLDSKVSVPPTSPASPRAQPTDCPVTSDGSFEVQLADLINQERGNEGISPLVYQSPLAAASRGHSHDMACNSFFSHTGSDSSSPASRAVDQGYSFTTIGENIYAGSGPYNSPDQAFNAWMNSPGHRTNMLNPEFTEIGVGHAFCASSPYGGYFTAMFGKP